MTIAEMMELYKMEEITFGFGENPVSGTAVKVTPEMIYGGIACGEFPP